MVSPKISIITSCYNDTRYIDASVSSLLQQMFVDFELLIVDDASTDDSLSLLRRMQQHDSRIVLIENESNRGLTKSLNTALRSARGRYIARQDMGDISLPDRLQVQYNFLESHQDIFLCGTDFDYIDAAHQVIPRKEIGVPVSAVMIAQLLPKKNCFTHSTIMFRREHVFYRDKFYYAQDYDLYLLCLSQGKNMVNLQNKLVHCRMDARSISYIKKEQQDLFAKQAKLFFQERTTQEQDGYEAFDPAVLLHGAPLMRSNESLLLENQMVHYLQNRERGSAKKIYYQQYIARMDVRWHRKIVLFIFAFFPGAYRLYRWLAYHDQPQ